MKVNSKKILLWLYQSEGTTPRRLRAEDLRQISPELLPSGFRSLLNLLKSKSLIAQERIGSADLFSLTSYGRAALEAYFPALTAQRDSWRGEWQLIVFIEAPGSDKQFRYLRQYLLTHGCGQLSRGNYLFPGKLPLEIEQTLNRLYVSKVMVMRVRDWSFGDERLVVSRVFNLADQKSVYSGISNEVDRLLRRVAGQKSIGDKDKMAIRLVFDRLVHLLGNDWGLLSFYYPELKSGVYLLSLLQSIS